MISERICNKDQRSTTESREPCAIHLRILGRLAPSLGDLLHATNFRFLLLRACQTSAHFCHLPPSRAHSCRPSSTQGRIKPKSSSGVGRKAGSSRNWPDPALRPTGVGRKAGSSRLHQRRRHRLFHAEMQSSVHRDTLLAISERRATPRLDFCACMHSAKRSTHN